MANLKNEGGDKKRKVMSTPLRDKSRTMAKMVAAVGKVIQEKGYPGLTATNLAAAATVDTKLIYTYFGNVDQLIEEYIHKGEYWKIVKPKKRALQRITDEILDRPDQDRRLETINIFQEYFDIVSKDVALQRVIHWEMGAYSRLLRGIADKREELGEQLLQSTYDYFDKSDVDIRSTLAILIGGIYFLNIHGRMNGSMCFGIDINHPEDKKRIQQAITDTINRAYDAAL